MASISSSMLALSDLINFQLERLNLNEFVYKDELHLQKLLAELDQKTSTSTMATTATSPAAGQMQNSIGTNSTTNATTTTPTTATATTTTTAAAATTTTTTNNNSNSSANLQSNSNSTTTTANSLPTAGTNGNQQNHHGPKSSSTRLQHHHQSSKHRSRDSQQHHQQYKYQEQNHHQAIQTQMLDLELGESNGDSRQALASGANGGSLRRQGSSGGSGVAASSGFALTAAGAGSIEYVEEEIGAVGGGLSGTGNGGGVGAAAAGPLAPSIAGSEDSATTSDLQKEFKSRVLVWFQQLHDQTRDYRSEEESKRMREAGNDSYRKERHPLKASDFFTEAIFLAPVDSIAAAMAHANRSTVLHDWGMYEQSYDDCLSALDLGYPEEYYPLIKLRQAACALKMRNFALCELHLHEMLHMDLSEAFEARTHELWHQCEVQKSETFEIGVQTGDDLPGNGGKSYEIAWHDNTNIITTNKGAHLRSTVNISANTPIFREKSSAFVASGQARICDNCAITQFIPFPCHFCTNRSAVYCSRKCRAEHASIHALECFAHQIELFEEFAECFTKPRLLQLAFRMLVTGLPEVVVHCRKKPTVNKMWAAFNGVLTERTDIPYSALLRLEAHVGEDDVENLVSLAVISHIMAIYLGECTDFFEQLELAMPAHAKLSSNEWELLSAALLLRHICQLRHKNLIHCPSFVLPSDQHVLATIDEFQLWTAVKRLRRGHLHLLAGDVANVALAVYPHTLSLCRHSCVGALFKKFSGRKLTTYATSEIALGSPIVHCFTSGNYQQSLYETRKMEMNLSGIDCKCDKCFRPYPDEDFHKFHRYRCDNPNCKQIFTPPPLKRTRNLRWWNSVYYTRPENNGSELLVCSVCEETQKLEWFWTFSAALIDCDSIEERCKLYAAIEEADNHLVEMHECKVALARQLVEQCLLIHREGLSSLEEWEFNKLGSAMRSALHVVAAQYRVFSIEYVQHMTYFWDVMALSNYKCSDKELMQMLQALDYIPDEFKEIFINYYEDYIASKYTEETYASIMDTQV